MYERTPMAADVNAVVTILDAIVVNGPLVTT